MVPALRVFLELICVIACRRVTNRLSARRMRQKRAEEREAVAQEVMPHVICCMHVYSFTKTFAAERRESVCLVMFYW